MRKTQDNNDINSIATGSVLSGDLHTKSDIRVDGEVKGSVKTEGKLVLGETGLIEGQIFCKNAVVSGEIRATINVEELLTLKSTAKLNGEIVSEKLAIEPADPVLRRFGIARILPQPLAPRVADCLAG